MLITIAFKADFRHQKYSPQLSYSSEAACLQHSLGPRPGLTAFKVSKMTGHLFYKTTKENQFSIIHIDVLQELLVWAWSFNLLKYILGHLGFHFPKNIYLFFILMNSAPIVVFLLSKYIENIKAICLISRLSFNKSF